MQKALGLIAAIAGILIILAASARIFRIATLKKAAPRAAREELAPPSVPAYEKPAAPVPEVPLPPLNESARQRGTIRGVVKLDGPAPKPRRVKIVDAYCDGSTYDQPYWSEEVVVGEAGVLANVIVKLTGGVSTGSTPAPVEPFTLRQKGCRYVPHVFVVRAGQKIIVTNEDDTMHNIHPLAVVNPELNCTGRPGQPVSFTFQKPEPPLKIKCDVHPWMSAWCLVSAHPYAVVTGIDGAFAFGDLNPGEYTIEVWHEKYGTQSKTVVVDGDVALQFGYKP